MLYSQLGIIPHNSFGLSLLCNQLLDLFMFVDGQAADTEKNIHLLQREAFCLRHKEVYEYHATYHKASKEKKGTIRYVGQHVWGRVGDNKLA